MPVVVDVAGNRNRGALFGAIAVGMVGDLGFDGHVAGAPLDTDHLPAMLAGALFEICTGVAGTREQAPVFVDGRRVETAFDAPVTTPRNRPCLAVVTAAEAFTGVGLDAQLSHVMHIAQAAEALHLAVVRVARNHVVGKHVELAPLLQVHRGVRLAHFQADVARGLGFGFLEDAFGAPGQIAGAVHVGLGQAQADVARSLGDQRFQTGFAARQVAAVDASLGRQLLGVHPRVVGVADGQTLEFDTGFLAVGEPLGNLVGVLAFVAFLQGVEQRGGVFDPVIGLGVGGAQRLAIQRLGFFRLALVEVGRGHPAHGVGRQLHAFAFKNFVLTDHFGGTRPRLERAEAVDAPAHHVVMGGGVRGPAGEQFVVIRQGAVGNHVAVFFAARGELGHAHALGGEVAFQAPLSDRVQQAGTLGRQAQRGFRQAGLLQGNDVFAGNVGFVAGADKRLVEFKQRVVVQAGAGQRVPQGHAPVGVIGLGGHQRTGALHGFGGLATVGLGQGEAQLQVDVIWLTQQRLAIDRLSLGPLLLIAIGARHGGERLGAEVAMFTLGLVHLKYFSILAGPTGDHHMIADLAWRLALGRQLTQLGKGGCEVAVARLDDQRVIGRIGHGESGHQ